MHTVQIVVATHIGHCLINEGLLLKNILLISCFQYNLVSVSQLYIDLECSALFHSTQLEIQVHSNGRIIGTGRFSGELFYLQQSIREVLSPRPQPAITSLTEIRTDLTLLWHR